MAAVFLSLLGVTASLAVGAERMQPAGSPPAPIPGRSQIESVAGVVRTFEAAPGPSRAGTDAVAVADAAAAGMTAAEITSRRAITGILFAPAPAPAPTPPATGSRELAAIAAREPHGPTAPAPRPPATRSREPAATATHEPRGPTAPAAAGHPPPPPAGEGRFELTAAQMDAITAGLTGIEIDALAVALGPPAGHTATDVETHAFTDEDGLYEVAYGRGEALAAGEATDVHGATELYADGAVVVGSRFAYEYDLPGYSEGHTGGFVVSVDADHPEIDAVMHVANVLAQLLERDYQRAALHVERGQWLLERNPEQGEQYLETHLERDRDDIDRHFDQGVDRLLQVLGADGQ